MQIPMTSEEISRARYKLYHFFPELSVYSSVEYCSFGGGKKQIVFYAENVPPQSIKCIAMDFSNEVFFQMQIYSKGHGKIFTDPNGSHSNHFYSLQPGLYSKWASQSKFIPPDRKKDEVSMHIEIPYLKENGMGFFLFENDDMRKCENSEQLKIQFLFSSPENMPKRFTIYILR